MRRRTIRKVKKKKKKLLTLMYHPARTKQIPARRMQGDIDAREGEIFIRVSTSADLVNS